MRITNKKELKLYLLERVKQADIYRESIPSRYDALMDVCGNLLNTPFLKYVDVEKIDKNSQEFIESEFMSIYVDFIHHTIQIEPDVTADERKNLKAIIDFLRKITDSDEKLIASWRLILGSWDKYPNSIKEWTNIRYIRRNLQTIISLLKNKHKNGRQQKNQQASEDFESIAAELALRSGKESGEGNKVSD